MTSLSKEEQQLLRDKYGGESDAAGAAFEADRERLAAGEPLAYVIGWQPFLGLKIHLDSHPLIPRPETEWWTEELINELSGKTEPLHVLDLCAGSGAIGCALLAQLPNAQVSFGELMPAHAATIVKNIEENGLDTERANVRTGDLFEPFGDETFDLIVTNPPYIPDARELDTSVTDWEPKEALRAGEEGLALIRRIAQEAPARMRAGGQLWLECDSEHADAALALITEGGAKYAEIRTDLYGRPRIIVGYYA